MRFRRKLGWIRLATWIAFGLFLAFEQVKRGRPLWIDFAAFVICILLFLPSHLFWYWEIRPDRLIHQRYLARRIFPFSEIVYIGPMTGKASDHETTRNWILVRSEGGQRMIVDTNNHEGFLSEMRKYLPSITLKL
jgi:hypothetical protein